MNNWQKIKLIDVADVKLSNVDKKTNSEEIEIKLCNYTDVYKHPFISKSLLESFMTASCNDNEYKKFKLKKGQVAVTKDSEKPNDIGIPTYIKDDFDDVVLGYHLALFTPDKAKLDGRFLYYWLNTKQAKRYFENNAGGSGQRCSLSIDILKSTPLYLPKLNEQKSIAKVLSDLDAKIELNNKINRELEAMAKTLYDYWFVQFDFPNKNGEPYKASGGKMVYNEELKREIPEGWEVGTIDDIANLVRGVSYNKDDIKSIDDNGTIPILRATNITGNVIDLENMVYVSEEFANEQQLLNKFDILITMSSGSKEHIGKNGFYYFDDKVAFGAFCAKLVGKDNYYFYLYSYTQSEFISATIKNECLGTNINNLNGSLVKGFKLPIPSSKVLDKFNKSVSKLYERIANNTKQNQKLTELRDWLLPMLMNGQVTVRQAHGSVVGEVDEKLSSSAELSRSMVAEPQKGNENCKSLPKLQEKEERHFLKRKMLASYIINQSLEDKQFGDVKFEKLLHLTDYFAIQRNFGQNYYKKPAGPYDNGFTYPFFQQVIKDKWFRKENYGNLHRITAGENNKKSLSTYDFFSNEELQKVNQLIVHFKTSNYESPEIVSTLYAVWNNRIIKQQEITDDFIKQDFLDWDKQKAKYKNRLDGALNWMRDNGIVPNGWGKYIDRKKNK